ncbi:MAG: hypothetical protein R3D00_30930 [Bacteroidia bacterium]
MIRIKKEVEPLEWKAKRMTPGFNHYEPIPELRNALLKEQGYICAYCMREIPVSKKDLGESETSKIEHIKSRENHPHKQLDYTNMVICCPGSINGNTHCDKSKESAEITFSPFDISLQESISYGSYDGKIKSGNGQWNDEIDKIICLNNAMLMYNRKQTLDAIVAVLKKQKWKKAKIKELIDEWSNPDHSGKLKQYCGIVIWYLKKKLRQM